MTEQTLETTEVKPKQTRNTRASRERSTTHQTNKDAALNRAGEKFSIEFGDRSRPRQILENDDLNLSIPEGIIPHGYHPEWIPDNGKGSLDKAVANWWGFMTDSQGVRYARPMGNGKMQYLMVIEQRYYDEMVDLRMSRYRASIGEDDDKSLGIQGLETYTPNGVANKIKVTTDPFTS